MKLSNLNENQKKHLAWRLDKTVCGYCTAAAVARGDHGDLELIEIFEKYGDRSRRSAQIHARKVIEFAPDLDRLVATEFVLNYTPEIIQKIRQNLDGKQHLIAMELLSKCLDTHIRLEKIVCGDS